jgi:hypothetical protein
MFRDRQSQKDLETYQLEMLRFGTTPVQKVENVERVSPSKNSGTLKKVTN